jgi:hypothetical protein
MLSDPRIGFGVSLGVAAVAALWLLAQWLAAEVLWPRLGYAMHAVTLLAIFLLAASGPIAYLFRHYARVREDLRAGRDVIARWRVDPELFRTFGRAAVARDSAEKRSALYAILLFMLLVFGAFALFDPQAASGMLAIGALAAAAIVAAFALGKRTALVHARLRSGEIIVGRSGLLANDVLHVWGSFLSRLSKVSLHQGRHPSLTISYFILTRLGPQEVSVDVPFSPDQLPLAQEVQRRLGKA